MTASMNDHPIPFVIREAFSVKDRVAIVTGAAGFIGRVIAEAFAANGATVVCSDRAGAELNNAVAALKEKGYAAVAHPAELTSPADLKALVARATRDFGHLDILINCGAIPQSPPLEHCSEEDFDRLYHTNVRSVWLLIKYAVEPLEKSVAAGRGGNVVSIASINAHHPGFPCSLYASGKAAVVMMTRELAAELGEKRIRLNTVSPGVITHPARHIGFMTRKLHEPYATEYRERFTPVVEAREGAYNPLPFGGRPIDVAMACLYLASPAARFVTGADVLVDGGKNCMFDHQFQRKDDAWDQARAYLIALPESAWKEAKPRWLTR